MFTYSPFHNFSFSKSDQSTAIIPNVDLTAVDLISNFFVTCLRLTKKEEEEHKRILYYYPHEETPKRKAEITGMAGAVAGLTSELIRLEKGSPIRQRRSHRFIWSAKTASIILPVENDFIIGATFNRELCDAKSYYPHCGTLLKMVENMYETFKLFYGPFELEFEKETKTKQLELKLNVFFTNFLPTIRLSTVPLIDHLYFGGISFMPLSAKLFLETQCLVEQASEECPDIIQAMFLYQNRLSQHTIEKKSLKTLFHFVSEHLIPYAMSKELQPECITQSGHFVEASFDFAPQEGPYPLVKLINSETKELETFHLIIYRSLNATLCMLVRKSSDPAPFLNRLQQFLSLKMAELGSEMGEALTELSRPSFNGVPFHFIYYNYDNLSFQTSLKMIAQSSNFDTINFTKEINRAIFNAFDKFIERKEDNSHMDLKLGSLWVVFKKSNHRLLVVFLSNSANTSLEDMHNYLNSILQPHFDHVLLD